MSDERFANLETMVAFQEDTIQKLNDVVYKQQLMIDRLEEKVDALTKHVLGPAEPAAEENENKA